MKMNLIIAILYGDMFSKNEIIIKYENISAVILAGGNSKRFGENKALIKINNQPVIEIITNKLKKVFSKVIISSNQNFDFLKLPIINDMIPNHGPLSGIHAGLNKSNTDKTFFISCDMPLIDYQSINFIIENSDDFDITVPIIKNFPVYVCGVYKKKLLNEIEKLFNQTKNTPSIKNLTKIANTNFIEIEKEDFYNEMSFINMNTIEDYELIIEYFSTNHVK